MQKKIDEQNKTCWVNHTGLREKKVLCRSAYFIMKGLMKDYSQPRYSEADDFGKTNVHSELFYEWELLLPEYGHYGDV